MIRIGPGAKGLEGEREGFEGGGNVGATVWRREEDTHECAKVIHLTSQI